MTNDKNLFSNELDNLFEEVSLDEAAQLAGGEIKPTQKEYEKELIDKLNNNELLSEEIVESIHKHLDEGGDLDPRIANFIQEQIEQTKAATKETIEEPVDHQESREEQEEQVSEQSSFVEIRDDYITALGQHMSSAIKKTHGQPGVNAPPSEYQLSERIDHLNSQMSILRNVVTESSGRNMVSGIGQGGDGQTPGSGEVRLQKMDDVEMGEIEPGQTLCWDPDLNNGTGGFYPCDPGTGGGGSNLQPPVSGTNWNKDATSGTRTFKSCVQFDEPCRLYWGEEDDFKNEVVGTTYTDVDVYSIEFVTSIKYDVIGDGTYNSTEWIATCRDEYNNLITSEPASGISSPNGGPKGFYALTTAGNKIPTCDGTGGQCLEDANVYECNTLDPTSPEGQVWWGTESQALDRVNGHDGALLIPNTENINIVKILKATTCEETLLGDGTGEYNIVASKKDGTLVAFQHVQLLPIDSLNPLGFFIGSATEEVICDGTVEEQDQVEGFLPICEDPDPDCNTCLETDPSDTGYAPLYFGTGFTANSVAVKDDSDSLVNPVEKIIYTYSDDYVDNGDGTYTGVWKAIVKLRGVTLPVEYSVENETSGPNGTRGFFINLDDNLTTDPDLGLTGDPAKCLNPLDGGDETSDGEYKEGIVHSCSETDAVSPLLFGNPLEPSNAKDTGKTGTKVIKVFSLNYREESDNSSYEADWYVLYVDENGALAAHVENVTGGTPVPPTDGFYLDTTNSNCIEDPDEDLGERIRFGYSPGCTAIVDENVNVPVYWGLGVDINNDTNTGETANKIVAIVSLDAGKDHDGTWNAICLKVDGSVIVTTYPTDGTTERSPFNGFYLDINGQVCKDDEEIPGGGEGPTLYPVPEGPDTCTLTTKGTELHWASADGTAPIVAQTDGTDVTDAIEIVKRVFIGYDQYGDCGEFVCLYRKDDGTGNPGTETFITDPVSGCYPDQYFTLDLTPADVTCTDPDPGEIIEGDREIDYGKFTGCRETSQPSDLFWGQPGDNSSAIASDAIKILEIVSFNSNSEGYGDWICLYVEKVAGTSSVKSISVFGQSPPDGFYLDSQFCINDTPPIQRPAVSLGYIAGCPKIIDSGTGEVQESDLMWDDGDGTVIDTGNDVKILLLTFSYEKVLPGVDTNWYSLSVGIDDKVVVHGPQGPSESPPAGYLVQSQGGSNDICAYDEDNIPQPGAEEGPFELIPTGCSQTSGETKLKWGTQEDGMNGLGDDVENDSGPIYATHIDRTFVTNRFENGYGDYYCVYRNTDGDTGVQQIVKRFDQTPVNSIDHGFFLDLDGVSCILGPDASHDPVQGLIHDCREVSGIGDLHWGDANEFNSGGNVDTDLNISGVKLIRNVTSNDSDNQGYGNWTINYELTDGTQGAIKVYGRSGIYGPEGAFLVPDADSFCVTSGDGRVTTREVILVNAQSSINASRSLELGTGEVAHQEEANAIYARSITKLNVIKPNVYMTEVQATEDEDVAALQLLLPLRAVRDPNFVGDEDAREDKFVTAPYDGDLWVVMDDDGDKNRSKMFVWKSEGTLDSDGYEQPQLGVWIPIAGAGGGGGANTTDEVILINTVRLAEFYIDQGFDPDLTTVEEFLEKFPLSTQEDANLLNIELLKEINKRKPTIHVVVDIHAVKGYRPMVGDLWVNPLNYKMYVCNFNKDRAESLPGAAEPRWYHWIEVGGGGGGEGGGNNIFLQPIAPSIANRADLWIDENTYYVYVWNGAVWVALTGDLSAITKEFKVHMSPDAPEDPEVGKLWFDTEMSEMRIYYDNKAAGASKVWVSVFNPGVDRTKIPQETRVQELESQLFEVTKRLQILESSRNTITFDPNEEPSGNNPYQ